ncbi:MFS general substrate transporter [Rhizopogon vinicolor AM-OR11-026]|uniref:MFS general substrate transporter n=1 Tax=Rhizopogon vinicolor AM-OR11-026 TaxID=1314800 RepID=A0A1B7MLT4_9AGAM|nr:MFS general substrate transporter [Rhizopogon vinicolor AM-OR11-026]
MESKPSLRTAFTQPRVSCGEDKEGAEISHVFQMVEHSDSLSLSDEFPEGGLKAWTTAFGVFLVQFCGFGYTTSFGVYEDFYNEHYLTNETSSAISWIGSFNTFLVTSACLISGPLYDRGYFYHVIITGAILQSFSLFMLSLAKPNQYYQIFLAQGVCLGIASGLMNIPSIVVISQHFRRKRTLVMAFVVTGSSLGAIIHPIMLNNLLNSPVGFANGVRISAAMVSGLLLIACLCMRTRLDPPTTPVNYIAASKKCIHDVPLMFMIAGGLLFQVGYFYPLFFFQLDSVKHGISITFSFYSLVILNASSCVGRVTSGYIAAYTGAPNLIVIATFSCGVIILGMIGLNSLVSVVVFGVFYGYFAGLYIAMLAPLAATLTPDISELGGRMGIVAFISGFGSLIGTPIAGALLTSNYIWWMPTLFAGVIALVGSMTYGIMRFMFIRSQMGKQALKCQATRP